MYTQYSNTQTLLLTLYNRASLSKPMNRMQQNERVRDGVWLYGVKDFIQDITRTNK
jgi:hypothetical protein